MNNKKNLERFTIKFKPKEPKHRMAIDILNSQGRNKADYIAQAVLEFEKKEAERVFLKELSNTVKETIKETLGSVEIVATKGTMGTMTTKIDVSAEYDKPEELFEEAELISSDKQIALNYGGELMKSLEMFNGG